MGSAPLLGTTPRRRHVLGLLTTALLLAAVALGASDASAATLFGTVSSQAPGQALAPAAGASVTVLDAQNGATVGLGTTGLDGSYSLAVPSGAYDVRFDPPGGGELASTTVAGIAVDVSRKLDVVLVPAGVVRLTGIVRDPTGPVAGVDVGLAGDAFAVDATRADGSYSLAVPAGSYQMQVSGSDLPGLPEQWAASGWRVDMSTDRSVDVTLPATVGVTLRVVGAGGEPIAGAQVKVPGGFGRALEVGASTGSLHSWNDVNADDTGVTDTAGEVRFAVFDGTSPGGVGVVTPPDDSGYAQETFVAPTVDGDTAFDVGLTPTVRLTGVLRDPNGPVAGADVALGGQTYAHATTGPDGSYAIAVVPGRYRLSAGGAAQPGLPDQWSVDAGVIDMSTDRAVDLTLPATVGLTLRVHGPDGAAIAGAQVKVPGGYVGAGPGGTSVHSFDDPNADYTGTTDAAGEVRFAVFDGTSPGGVGVVTPPDDSGYPQETFEAPTVDGETAFDVTFTATVRLTGAVRDPRGPVAGVDVGLAGPGAAHTTTGEDGSYAVAVAPGDYHASVSGSNLSGLPDAWSLSGWQVDMTADRTMDVALPATVGLTLRVLGTDGEPVAGAQVRLPNYHRSLVVGDATGSLSSWNDFVNAGYAGVTDLAGEVRFAVFDGTVPDGTGVVTPPDGSGYLQRGGQLPTIDGAPTRGGRFTSSTPPDTTAPAVACDPPPSGWHADEVTVACTASDSGAGLADAADESFSLTTSVGDGDEDASAQTGTREVCDRAGNCATAGPVGPIAVDRAAPRIAFSQQPSGGNGWWIASPGSTHATATDRTIATLDCTLDGVPQSLAPTAAFGSLAADVVAAAEGRHAVSCTATDAVGHSASSDDDVLIDQTAPNAPRLTADRAPDYPSRGGWYRDGVTVSVLGAGDPPLADGGAGSGVDPARIPAPTNLTTSGNHSVTGSVADLAGNTSLTTTAVFRVDADPPQTTLSCPTGIVRRGAKASARWRDRDGESGLATTGTGSIALDTSRAGTYTVQHTALDDVGHSASGSCSYTVA